MFDIDENLQFVIFTIVSLGTAIGMHDQFLLYLYMIFWTTVGMSIYWAIKHSEKFDDDIED